MNNKYVDNTVYNIGHTEIVKLSTTDTQAIQN